MDNLTVSAKIHIPAGYDELTGAIARTIRDLAEDEQRRQAFSSSLTARCQGLNIDGLLSLCPSSGAKDISIFTILLARGTELTKLYEGTAQVAHDEQRGECFLTTEGNFWVQPTSTNQQEPLEMGRAIAENTLKLIWQVTQRNIEDDRYRFSRRGANWYPEHR